MGTSQSSSDGPWIVHTQRGSDSMPKDWQCNRPHISLRIFKCRWYIVLEDEDRSISHAVLCLRGIPKEQSTHLFVPELRAGRILSKLIGIYAQLQIERTWYPFTKVSHPTCPSEQLRKKEQIHVSIHAHMYVCMWGKWGSYPPRRIPPCWGASVGNPEEPPRTQKNPEEPKRSPKKPEQPQGIFLMDF